MSHPNSLAILKSLDPGGTVVAALAIVNGKTVVVQKPYMATTRTLMRDLGPITADAIITALEAASSANSVVARTLKLLDPAQGGIDLSDQATVAQIELLTTASVLDQPQHDALIALGQQLISPLANAGWTRVATNDDMVNARAIP